MCGYESLPKVSRTLLPDGEDHRNLIKLSEALIKDAEAFSQKQGAGQTGA